MAKAKKSARASTSKTTENSSSSIRQLGAFRVLRVGSHYFYMRAHDGEDERTMFLVNLPTDATERHLKFIFASAGAIESVRLWKAKSVIEMPVEEETSGKKKGKEVKKDSGPPQVIPLPPLDPRHPHQLLPTATSAHITFLDDSSLQRALNQSHVKSWPDPFQEVMEARARMESQEEEGQPGKKKKSIRTAAEAAAASHEMIAPPVGLEYLIARHRALRPSLASIKSHVDSVIANFEYRRAHPEKKKSGIQAVSVGPNGELLDEDGFVIVQSTGKYGRTQEGVGGSSIKVARRRNGSAAEAEDDAAREKKRKRFELEDFYRFQRREEKREELANLRAKFRDDQEKVKKLKASRNFKPF